MPIWILFSSGLIYIFNLIVGTGALTLPAAFSNAGWALSTFIIILLGNLYTGCLGKVCDGRSWNWFCLLSPFLFLRHPVCWIVHSNKCYSLTIAFLAFMSFLTATFVIESMASANAVIHWKRLKRLKRNGGRPGSDSDQIVAKSLQVGYQQLLFLLQSRRV